MFNRLVGRHSSVSVLFPLLRLRKPTHKIFFCSSAEKGSFVGMEFSSGAPEWKLSGWENDQGRPDIITPLRSLRSSLLWTTDCKRLFGCGTAAVHCCRALLPCTAAMHCCHALLTCTAAMHCCHALLPCTADMHCWHSLLLSTAPWR